MKAALIAQSWYAYPGRARRYHVAIGTSPSCNVGALLNETTKQDAALVPDVLRCQRRGCKGNWPAVSAELLSETLESGT